MNNFRDLFGANPTKHKTVGTLRLVARTVNPQEGEPAVYEEPAAALMDNSHLVSIQFPRDFMKEHGPPVMIYTIAGLGYQPNEIGSFGTFVFLNAQYVYLVDGDAIYTHPESSDTRTFTFNFGGTLEERVAHIRAGWRFAVQAAVIYEDGTIKLTDWDFMEVIA